MNRSHLHKNIWTFFTKFDIFYMKTTLNHKYWVQDVAFKSNFTSENNFQISDQCIFQEVTKENVIFWHFLPFFTWRRPLNIKVNFKKWHYNFIFHHKCYSKIKNQCIFHEIMIKVSFFDIFGVFFTWRRPLIQKVKFKRWH